MTRDDDHSDGSKLALPCFDPKDPTYFDDLQAYAQGSGLCWLLHANGKDTGDISGYEDMQSDTCKNLQTTGGDATGGDKDKAKRWIRDSAHWSATTPAAAAWACPCGGPWQRPEPGPTSLAVAGGACPHTELEVHLASAAARAAR